MSALKLNSPGGGSVTLQPPSTSSNLTVTLPTTSITLSEVNTDNVLAAIAGASVGAVGTYALLASTAVAAPGSLQAGSALRYSSLWDSRGGPSAVAATGTWRCMGDVTTTSLMVSVWLRVS